MGSVDEDVDAFGREIVGKPLGAAEPAGPHRHGLSRRRGGAACERDRDGQVGAIGEAFRKPSRLRRATEDEDASHVAG